MCMTNNGPNYDSDVLHTTVAGLDQYGLRCSVDKPNQKFHISIGSERRSISLNMIPDDWTVCVPFVCAYSSTKCRLHISTQLACISVPDHR